MNVVTSSFLLLLLLVAGPLPVSDAQAQSPTPVTTIENGGGDTRLQLTYNGGLYVPGTYGPTAEDDSIPAEGPGTRLMWYPAKGAIRAGEVGVFSSKGDVWDADSIGLHSVAFGQDTKANGFAATAMGQVTTASGGSATAMGTQTTASGESSTAMGLETTARGKFATATGQNTIAATNRSLSVGAYNDKNRGNDDDDPSTGPLFVVGNGDFITRSDALVLDQSGNLTISGSLTQNSDRRLKEDVRPLGAGVLEKLMQIQRIILGLSQ
ncbi:MAG: hypothetical protein ABEL97_02460 [Salinibacter sp.]